MNNFFIQLHFDLFFWLHNLAGVHETLDSIILFFGRDADFYVIALAMIFILVHQHKQHKQCTLEKKSSKITELFLITYGVFASWLASFVLKYFIGGLRPFERFNELQPLFIYGGGDSFPSGHATVFSVLAIIIFLLHKKVGSVFIFLTLLISLSRVISGIHYPVDIIVGLLIGSLVGYLFFRFLKPKYFC